MEKIDQLKILGDRLKKINIIIECHGNFPWIYLYKVNDILVKEKLDGNHGFTIAWLKKEGIVLNNEYKKIFDVLRKYYYISKYTEIELIEIAERHLIDKKANFAMKILREEYDKTYGWCEDCDGLVITEKNCCLNRNLNEQTSLGL